MGHGVKITRSAARRMAAAVRKVEAMPQGKAAPRPTPRPGNPAAPFAEITSNGTTAGTYKAKEKVWDGTAFIDLSPGRLWDEIVLPAIVDVNLTAGLAAGQIVRPRFHGDNGTGFAWFFETAPAVKHPFRASIDPISDSKIKVGLDRSAGVFEDLIIIGIEPTANQFALKKSFDTPETITITENSFVYYEIQRRNTANNVALIEATLKTSPIFPRWTPVVFTSNGGSLQPGADVAERFNIVIGAVTFASGKITEWRQEWFKHIEIEANQTSLKYIESGGAGTLQWVTEKTSGPIGMAEIAIPTSSDTVISYQYSGGGVDSFFMELESAQQDDEILFFEQLCHIKTDGNGKLIHLWDHTANDITRARRYELGLSGIAFRWDRSNSSILRDVPVSPTNAELRDLIGTLIRDLDFIKIIRAPL